MEERASDSGTGTVPLRRGLHCVTCYQNCTKAMRPQRFTSLLGLFLAEDMYNSG
jgi:hypothetical protein